MTPEAAVVIVLSVLTLYGNHRYLRWRDRRLGADRDRRVCDEAEVQP